LRFPGKFPITPPGTSGAGLNGAHLPLVQQMRKFQQIGHKPTRLVGVVGELPRAVSNVSACRSASLDMFLQLTLMAFQHSARCSSYFEGIGMSRPVVQPAMT
jgi:hypothetical protein